MIVIARSRSDSESKGKRTEFTLNVKNGTRTAPSHVVTACGHGVSWSRVLSLRLGARVGLATAGASSVSGLQGPLSVASGFSLLTEPGYLLSAVTHPHTFCSAISEQWPRC